MSRFSNILVHVDSRAATHPALDCAADLAKANHGRLTIVDVVPDFGWRSRLILGGYERALENVTQGKSKLLKELATPLTQQGIDVTTKLLDGHTSVEIIRLVMKDGHDLVVKSAKGQHSQQTGFFGTTATRLIRKCPCPVLILKSDCPRHCGRVVAAVKPAPDDETHAQLNARIIRAARKLTSTGEPHVISVWNIYGESILRDHMQEAEFQELEERTEKHAARNLEQLLEPFGMSAEADNIHLMRGEPGHCIPQFVEQQEADLLVLGSVGRTGVAGLLIGNTAE